MNMAKVISRVVEATGTAAPLRRGGANPAEIAMSEAAAKAQAEGITDPGVIRERIMAAVKDLKNG